MKVYIVRHGESKGNELNFHHTADTPLSKNGILQAKRAAKRFQKVKIDIILSSEFERAQHTARIISKQIKKKIITTPLLNEKRRAPEMNGTRLSDPIGHKVWLAQYKHINDPKWHYSKEENYTDFRRRAKKLLNYLKNRKEKSVILLTHSHMTRMMVAVMLLGDKFDFRTYLKMQEHLQVSNTGITECEFKDGKWRVITWNNAEHLA